jgi:hypothetical protein
LLKVMLAAGVAILIHADEPTVTRRRADAANHPEHRTALLINPLDIGAAKAVAMSFTSSGVPHSRHLRIGARGLAARRQPGWERSMSTRS